MKTTMIATIPIDKAGRLVLPKEIRARLDLKAGDLLEVEWGGRELRLRARHDAAAKIVKQGRRMVWDAPGVKMTLDEWDESLTRGRKERDGRASGL